MLTRSRRLPQAEPAADILAATVAELPELDGARIMILGLHHGEARTIVHMLVSGVTAEDDWTYGRVVRPLPALCVRDGSGRWHATVTDFMMPSGTSGEVVLWLRIVPRWTAAPPGSIWSPQGDRPRSGSGCRSAGRETLKAIPRFPELTAPPGSSSLARRPRWTPGHLSAGRISWLTSPPKLRKAAQRSRQTRRSPGAIRC
jgi:hypothetical protein